MVPEKQLLSSALSGKEELLHSVPTGGLHDMPCHAGWKLTKPRPVHFRLAALLAQGKTPKECSQLTGISPWQVYRLKGSPLLQEMIAHARHALLEADTLARQGPDVLLTREEFKLLADLGQIRDFSPNDEHRLSACIKSLRLLE